MAGLGQPVKLDVQVLGGPQNPANVQSFAQSDPLERLFGEDHALVIPALAPHPNLVVPDGLKKRACNGPILVASQLS